MTWLNGSHGGDCLDVMRVMIADDVCVRLRVS